MESEPEGCYGIVYISTAIATFDEAALLQLLAQSRRYNQQAHITGGLMYANGNFVQVLEGSQEVIKGLFARIVADPRHGRIEKLADGPIARREFSGWYMSFAPPPPAFRCLPNYLTPPQLVLASLGIATQQVLSEFLAASAETYFM